MRFTLAFGAIALAVSLALTGCTTASSNSGSPAAAPTSASPTPTAPPVFTADGTAQENVKYLAYVVAQTQTADPKPDSAAVADTVAKSGFTRKGIQYTFSRTAAGLAADSMYIAVPWGDQCMIAQYGPVMTGVHTSVLPVLKQGGCLIGADVQTLR